MLNKKELGKAIAEAIRLKIESGAISSQADVARHFKIQPPSVNGWMTRGSISKDKLPALWQYFSDVVGPEHWGLSEWPTGTATHGITGQPEEGLSHKEDSVSFNVLDVKAACGCGMVNCEYPEIIRKLVMPIGEAQRLIGSTNRNGNIQIIIASKDSMIPAIYPEDLLFVDTSVKDYVGEAVYILLHGGELICKRISLVGKEITVSSDNQAYPSWPWRDKPNETSIVGKVIRVLPINFKKFGTM